jgi:periplasmic protein TonB
MILSGGKVLRRQTLSLGTLPTLPFRETDMNIKLITLLAAGTLAGCASPVSDKTVRGPFAASASTADRSQVVHGGTSSALTVDGYKRDLAQRISQANSTKVYAGRPQALLRSVIVVRYAVDAHGNLMRSEIVRSNRDGETEAIALATLRKTAPFPKPASHLLRRGHIEISETWLFNNDGRFQLRTIAEPQMDS